MERVLPAVILIDDLHVQENAKQKAKQNQKIEQAKKKKNKTNKQTENP